MGSSQECNLHKLVSEVLTCVYALTARSLSSGNVHQALLINKRIANLSEESPKSLAAVIGSFEFLAVSPEFVRLRAVIRALAKSLPCIWGRQFTDAEKRNAMGDLEALAAVALVLNAADVSLKLQGLINSM